MSAKVLSIAAPQNPLGPLKYAQWGEIVSVNGSRIPRYGGLVDASVDLPDGVKATRVDPWEYRTTNKTYRGDTEIVGASKFVLDRPVVTGWETFGLRFVNCNNGQIIAPKGTGPGNILTGTRGYGIQLVNCVDVTIDVAEIENCHMMIMLTGACRNIVIRGSKGATCHKVIGLHGGDFDKIYFADNVGFLEAGSPEWPTTATRFQTVRHCGPVEINGDIRGTVAFASMSSAADHGKTFQRAIRGQSMDEYWFPCVDVFSSASCAGLQFIPPRATSPS